MRELSGQREPGYLGPSASGPWRTARTLLSGKFSREVPLSDECVPREALLERGLARGASGLARPSSRGVPGRDISFKGKKLLARPSS